MNRSVEDAQIGKRIRDTRREQGLTLQDIATELGFARSTIQRYEAGYVGKIKLPVIEAIAKFLKVNPAWLIFKSEYKEAPKERDIFSIPNIYPICKKKLPLLGNIVCGEPTYAVEELEFYVECLTDIQADYCLKAHGDSMINARIKDGDIVFIRKQESVDNGEIAAVLIGDETTLKRVYQYGSNVILHAENPEYKDIEVDLEEGTDIRILGKAIAFQSDVR